MNVLDLMASITLDTSGYEQKLSEVAKVTENAASRMSTAAGATEEIEGGAEAAGESISSMGEAAKVTATAAQKLADETSAAGEAIDDSADSAKEYTEEAGKASKQTEDFGGSIERLVKKAAALVGIGKIFKDTIDQGAQLQQSIGGVETLFKESSQTVIANARRAYETAGMDANTYMETVTGFSASLLQSLGNDTEEAARLSDQAIIDMSDNANKMGTNIGLIMGAYQGFAKQNFTMLDNLKIGYGGTKTEMERLLKDAEALKKKQGEVAEYSIDSYADIVEAIHVVQTEMGITGTTAREAEETFTGSFNAMQASVKNLMGDLSTGTGDIDKDIRELSRTAITFVGGNLLPMVGNIYVGLNQVEGALGTIISIAEAGAIYMATMKVVGAVEAATAGTATLGAAVDVLSGKFKTLMAENHYLLVFAAVTSGALLAKKAIDSMTDAIEVGVNGYDYLTDAQKQLVDSTNETIAAIYNARNEREKERQSLEDNSEQVALLIEQLYTLDSAEKLNTSTKQEMADLIQQINELMPGLNLELDEETGHLKENREEIEHRNKQLEAEKRAIQAQKDLVTIRKDQATAEKAHTDASKELNAAYARRTELQRELEHFNLAHFNTGYFIGDDSDIDAFRAINAELEDLNENQIPELQANYVSVGATVRDLRSEASGEEFVLFGASVAGAFDEISKGTEKVSTVSLPQLTNFVSMYGDRVAEINAKTTNAIAKVNQDYEDAVAEKKGDIESSLNLFEQFTSTTELSAQQLMDNLISNQKGVQNWADNIRKLSEWGVDDGLIKALEEAGPESAAMLQVIIDAGQDWAVNYGKTWQEVDDTITGVADGLVDKMPYKAEKMMLSISGAVESRAEWVTSAFETVGTMAAAGVETGFITRMVETSESMGNSLMSAVDKAAAALMIESPSKLTRDLIGKNLAAGIGVGFEDEMENVLAQMDSTAENIVPELSHSIESPEMSPITGTDGSIITILTQILGAVQAGKSIYIDGDALVGATVDKMDAALGENILTTGGAVYA